MANLMKLDNIDAEIVKILSKDGRIKMRELADSIGMSSPSATERVRRLTDIGAIRAFTVDLDPKAFGYSLQIILRVKPLPGQLHFVKKILQDMPECIECDEVTGDDCFIARVCLTAIENLDNLLGDLKHRAETNTSIIHSSVVARRIPLG